MSNFPSSVDTNLTLLQATDGQSATLASLLTNVATTLSLSSAANFATGQIVVIDSEKLQITAGGNTTTPTVSRGYNSTTAATHSAGAQVNGYVTQEYHNNLTSAIIAIESNVPVLGSTNTFTSSNTFAGISASSLSLTTPLPVSSGGSGLSSTSQNFVFAGPTSGSGAPTFRALAAGDIPSLSATYALLTSNTFSGSQTINNSLTTNGTYSSGAPVGLTQAMTITGTSATNIYGITSSITLAASASVASANAITINSPSLGASAAVTGNAAALTINPQKVAGIGGTGYAIYQAGANDTNSFAGATTFNNTVLVQGTIPSTYALLESLATYTANTASGSFYATYSAAKIGTGSTTSSTSASAYYSQIVAAASTVSGFGYNIYIGPPNIGASATMTNLYGIYINPQAATGITNSYGIYQAGSSDINSFSGITSLTSLTCQTRTTTSADTMTQNDSNIVCNSGSTFTETLPSSPQNGREITIVNRGSAAVTVGGNGHNIWSAGSTSASVTLASNATTIMMYDSTSGYWLQVK